MRPMDAKKNPAYLRTLAAAVEGFRDAFERFLSLHEPDFSHRGVVPAVFPRSDVDPLEIESASRAVSRAAGLAAAAPALTHMLFAVQGTGAIDPIAAWGTVAQPKPLLEPSNILDACEQMLGRLEGFAVLADAEAPPTTGVQGMHPTVWGAARSLWLDGHFRQAVASAGERLAGSVKGVTERHDLADTTLWQQVFSDRPPEPGKPRLQWPGDPNDLTVKSMREGLRQFAPGVQMTVRNPAAHDCEELTAQEGMERLAALSLLAHWVDTCELQTLPLAGNPPAGDPS
jgi:hypothetical protein